MVSTDYKIVCRDFRKPFTSKSRLSQLCKPCKAILRKKDAERYASTRKASKQAQPIPQQAKTKKTSISDEEQKEINRRIDNSGIVVDPGRTIPRTSPEFHQIAALYYQRDMKERILCR